MLRSRPQAGTHPAQGLIGDRYAYGDVGVFWVLSFQQRQEAQHDKNHVQRHADDTQRHQTQEELAGG